MCVTAIPLAGGAKAVATATTTSSDGSFRIAFLPAGTYLVRFTVGCGARGYGTEWWRHGRTARQAATVTVTPSTTTSGIDVSLHRMAAFTQRS
jgi:hypothetical protein